MNAKIGVSYSVWDGEELLEASINSIRICVDYVNVVWQKESWFGEPCSEMLEELLMDLKEKGLINELILFEPNLRTASNANETKKRNIGLTAAKKANCTHFMTLDTDEFFRSDEFELAKQFILKHDITHSACNQLMYLTPTCRMSDPAGFFAPFLYKITKDEKLVQGCYKNSPWLIDPTKQIPIKKNSKICFMHNVAMHHYDKVRKDLPKKYRNSAARLEEKQQEEILNLLSPELIQKGLDDEHYIKTENYFNIKVIKAT